MDTERTVPFNDSKILRIRIPHGDRFAMGPGKADLLEAIEATRSISAAGRELGLSYRKVRTLLEDMQACFRGPLVETSKGGAARGGARLTQLGREALEDFRRIQARAWEAIRQDLRDFDRHLAPKDTPED